MSWNPIWMPSLAFIFRLLAHQCNRAISCGVSTEDSHGTYNHSYSCSSFLCVGVFGRARIPAEQNARQMRNKEKQTGLSHCFRAVRIARWPARVSGESTQKVDLLGGLGLGSGSGSGSGSRSRMFVYFSINRRSMRPSNLENWDFVCALGLD